MKIFTLALFVGLCRRRLTTSRACDLCGCYTPRAQRHAANGIDAFCSLVGGWFYAAVGEQFTRFATVAVGWTAKSQIRPDNTEAARSRRLWPVTMSTAASLYQLNVPLIYREFKRPEGFKIDRGTVSGLGDVSLLAENGAFSLRFARLGEALKFQDKNPIASRA